MEDCGYTLFNFMEDYGYTLLNFRIIFNFRIQKNNYYKGWKERLSYFGLRTITSGNK